MARAAFLIAVAGRVQGVGFRAFVRRNAARLGLDGWVRNRRDGTVEIMAIGERDAIDRLIEACNDGPPHAQVVELRVRGTVDDGATGFSELPTL